MVVISREDYEDLIGTLAAIRARSAIDAGEEVLTAEEENAAYLAASTPLAFWRKKRGLTQAELANDVGASQNFLSDIERGKAKGEANLYLKMTKRLNLKIVT
jgi:DNA-binding XRE family transcriptional regulator